MFLIRFFLKNLLESIIFFLNSTIFTFGLFNLLSNNDLNKQNGSFFIVCLVFGILGGAIIPSLSFTHRKIISKDELANKGTISSELLRKTIPFLIPTIIVSLIVSKLFISIILNINSLTELSSIKENLGFGVNFIITLAFVSIEILPFFIHLLLNNKDQVILEQTKEISNINEQLKRSYETQLKIVNSIQHELGNKLPIVRFSVSDLETHLTNLNEKGEININAKIRQPFEGESAENIASIQTLINVINMELQNSVLIVQNMGAIVQTDGDKTKKTPTIINDYIKDDLKYRKRQFSKNIRFEIDGENVAVNLDKSQFKVLLDNIYSNAIRHSFIDNEKQYNFKIHVNEKKDIVEIIFMNNGEPFPEKMNTSSYTELNEFYGDTGNSGIGGYLIGQVVRNHNGELSIEKRFEFQNFNTFITIKLPL